MNYETMLRWLPVSLRQKSSVFVKWPTHFFRVGKQTWYYKFFFCWIAVWSCSTIEVSIILYYKSLGNTTFCGSAWNGFLALLFKWRTELESTTKLSYKALHPPLHQTAVILAFLSPVSANHLRYWAFVSLVYIGGSPNSAKNWLWVSLALVISLSRSTSFWCTSLRSIFSSSMAVLT